MSQIAIEALQRGLETAGSGVPSDGSLVAATYQIVGEGSVTFDDRVELPAYPRGKFGPIIEDVYVAETGTTISLNDAELTHEDLVWDMNAAIKAVVGAATNFPFTFPTSSANSIRAYTYEYRTAAQEYEAGYGIFTEYNIKADADDNGGVFYRNAKIQARKAAASTMTSSLSKVANRENMNLRNAVLYLDTIGTAAGTSAASLYVKGFTLDMKTGWMGEAFATGRSDLDFSDAYFHNFELSGTLKCLMDSAAVTQIANMRAGTPKIIQLKVNGSSSRVTKFNLPLAWMGITGIGNERKDGLRMVTLNYKAGYSTTSVAQGAGIDVTLSTSTTVT